MTNLWLHRISYCADAAYPLLARNELTIGFSDFSSPEFIEKVCNQPEEAAWSYFEQQFHDIWEMLPRSRFSLWKYVYEMKRGDWVVVPKQGVFELYEILDDCPRSITVVDVQGLTAWGLPSGRRFVLRNGRLHYEVAEVDNEDTSIDIDFVRRVKRVVDESVPRFYCSAALTSRLKIFSTTANISDLWPDLKLCLADFEKQKPFNLQGSLLERHSKTTLNEIQTRLDPQKFEQLIKWYFESQGAKVVVPAKNVRGKAGDADVIATFDALRVIIYVQAKYHDGETDQWAVEQITAYKKYHGQAVAGIGSMDDGFTRVAWVVSTAPAFTEACIALAKENNVLLLSGLEFVRLLLIGGLKGLDTAM